MQNSQEPDIKAPEKGGVTCRVFLYPGMMKKDVICGETSPVSRLQH